jgi:hypothetical protein
LLGGVTVPQVFSHFRILQGEVQPDGSRAPPTVHEPDREDDLLGAYTIMGRWVGGWVGAGHGGDDDMVVAYSTMAGRKTMEDGGGGHPSTTQQYHELNHRN